MYCVHAYIVVQQYCRKCSRIICASLSTRRAKASNNIQHTEQGTVERQCFFHRFENTLYANVPPSSYSCTRHSILNWHKYINHIVMLGTLFYARALCFVVEQWNYDSTMGMALWRREERMGNAQVVTCWRFNDSIFSSLSLYCSLALNLSFFRPPLHLLFLYARFLFAQSIIFRFGSSLGKQFRCASPMNLQFVFPQ